MGRVSPMLLLLLACGFFFATYNLVTITMHGKASGSESNFGGRSGAAMGEEETKGSDAKFHVALTATDAPYSQWQCRIMYYWYKKMKDMPGSDMGKFTRVLHSGSPDNFMDEIPTFVVKPLPQGLDRVRFFFLFFFCLRFCHSFLMLFIWNLF